MTGDVRCPDCGRYPEADSPFVLYVKRVNASREYAIRNLDHEAAHRIAALEGAGGHRVHISLDRCG